VITAGKSASAFYGSMVHLTALLSLQISKTRLIGAIVAGICGNFDIIAII
jgi:hypothetical protein